MFSLYVDPEQIDPSHVFDADMARYLDWFRQAKADAGRGDPDARRARSASRARSGCASGVPLPEETWEAIVAAARSVGVNRDISL